MGRGNSWAVMVQSHCDLGALRGGGTRHPWRALVCAVLVSLATLGLGACSSDDSQLAFEEEPIADLYNEALNLLGEGNYIEAAEKFEDVERQHPYSVWARKAIVMSAFAYYQRGDYDQSIQAGKRYLSLHPGSSDAPYAQYLIAQSYYDQSPDVTRDQSTTESAMEALREVVRRYPETDYARDARRKLQEAVDQLAGKEMEIGRYYLNSKSYVAALNRFKTVVKSYQTSSHIEEALMRLTEAYMAMGITSTIRIPIARSRISCWRFVPVQPHDKNV